MANIMPIERSIAAVSQDRRRLWDQRMRETGHKRVSFWVPAERVSLLKELKAQLVKEADYEALMDFVTCSLREMLSDPECNELDRAFASKKLALLGGAPAPSGAREEAPLSMPHGKQS